MTSTTSSNSSARRAAMAGGYPCCKCPGGACNCPCAQQSQFTLHVVLHNLGTCPSGLNCCPFLFGEPGGSHTIAVVNQGPAHPCTWTGGPVTIINSQGAAVVSIPLTCTSVACPSQSTTPPSP